MSNQRPGKLQKPLDRNGDMQVYKFFKTASKVLKDAGKEDEAFYFEQMEDYIKSGKPLPTSEESITRALGVWQLWVVIYQKIGGYVVSSHPRFARSAVAQRWKI